MYAITSKLDLIKMKMSVNAQMAVKKSKNRGMRNFDANPENALPCHRFERS